MLFDVNRGAIWAALVGTIIYVAAHFIMKFW